MRIEKKAKAIQDFLDMQYPRTASLLSNTCAHCKGSAVEFRDELSRREYDISALCQDCQDKVFGVEEG